MDPAFRAAAVEAARRAGAYLSAHRDAVRTVDRKTSAINLVTEIDRGAEALIVDVLRGRFPDHAILAEEGGESGAAAAAHRWLVDPLDGTTNFVHGLPIYAVSIGLCEGGRPALGVVYDPTRDECFVAERGRGATVNGRPLVVSARRPLDESLLATGFPYNIRDTADGNLAEYAAFARRCRVVRVVGSAALCLAWVAAGRLDGYWELRLGPWDVAAGIVLVEEAGGLVTGLDGGPVDLAAPSVVAAGRAVHPEIVATLAEIRAR
ncbi:MAG TPA: inositol monophosphatase family protein [Candidatus Binatia bacterium]|nr:inositol monophosphatase family protein [Candidatus Binatia bacterium]